MKQPPSFSDRLFEQLRLAAELPPKPPETAEERAAKEADLAGRLDADIRETNARNARREGG